MSICGLCEDGELSEITFSDNFTVRFRDNATITVDGLSGLKCDKCGEILISMAQCKYNQELIQAAKRLSTGD